MAVMKQQEIDSFRVLMDDVFGQDEAVGYVMDVFHVFHVWDDLADGDNDPAPHELDSAFLTCMFRLPAWRLWDERMADQIQMIYFKWRAATDAETSTDPVPTEHALRLAYVHRAAMFDLILYVAFRLHGAVFARQVAQKVLWWYGEDWQDYLSEMRGEHHGGSHSCSGGDRGDGDSGVGGGAAAAGQA